MAQRVEPTAVVTWTPATAAAIGIAIALIFAFTFCPVGPAVGEKPETKQEHRDARLMLGQIGRSSHCLASCGTGPARFYAIVHLTDFFTTLGARLTNMDANGTNIGVVDSSTEHEVFAGVADGNAVEHKPDVLWFHVLPPNFQAVLGEGLQAGVMTFLAGVDARLHPG